MLSSDIFLQNGFLWLRGEGVALFDIENTKSQIFRKRQWAGSLEFNTDSDSSGNKKKKKRKNQTDDTEQI